MSSRSTRASRDSWAALLSFAARFPKPVDIVDIFREPSAVPPIVDEAIAMAPR